MSFDTTPAASYAESHLSNVTKQSRKPLSPETLKGCTISFDTGITRNRTKVRDEYEKRRDKTPYSVKIRGKRIDAISRPDPPKKKTIHDEKPPEELPIGSTVLKLAKVRRRAQTLKAYDLSDTVPELASWADGLRIYAPDRVDLNPILEPITGRDLPRNTTGSGRKKGLFEGGKSLLPPRERGRCRCPSSRVSQWRRSCQRRSRSNILMCLRRTIG